jgi:hypothetical protein
VIDNSNKLTRLSSHSGSSISIAVRLQMPILVAYRRSVIIPCLKELDMMLDAWQKVPEP